MMIVVGTINVINYNQINQTAEETLRILSENQGRFPDFNHGIALLKDKRPGFEMNEETRFQTRYFLVELNEEGITKEIDTSHISAVTSNDALEYTNKVISSGKTGGYAGYYKFRTFPTIRDPCLSFWIAGKSCRW